MDTNLNHLGYDLYEVADDQWIFDTKTGDLMAGTFQDVVRYMIKLGFNSEEIEVAVSEMVNREQNVSHFGMYKTFIYTFKKVFGDKKAG